MVKSVKASESDVEFYGALKEGLHIGGYTLERALAKLEALISGDAWKHVGGGFEDINKFMDSIRLEKFRLIAVERKRLANRIKELQPAVTNRRIGKVLKVSEGTIRNDTAQNYAPKSKKGNKSKGEKSSIAQNYAPTLSGPAAAKLVAGREARKVRDAEAAARLPTVVGNGSMECRLGDFRGVLSDLRDIDAIITDPPYERDFIPQLRDLAEFADKILKPDGVMAVLYGQTYLNEAIKQLEGFREYRWTACYLTSGNGYVSHARSVQSNWKPLLIYGGMKKRFGDVFKSDGDGAAKERHDWGQNFDTFQQIIEALTEPGAKIVDPFAGGGTTLLAAKACGRHAIGSEIDKDCEVFRLDQLEAAE